MHTTVQEKCMKRTHRCLSEVIRSMEKLNTAQCHSYFIPPLVNVMSSDDNCFACGKQGHIGHHCPMAQYYNCDAFGHFTQNCPKKIAPSGTPYITTDLTPTDVVTTAAVIGHTPPITD